MKCKINNLEIEIDGMISFLVVVKISSLQLLSKIINLFCYVVLLMKKMWVIFFKCYITIDVLCCLIASFVTRVKLRFFLLEIFRLHLIIYLLVSFFIILGRYFLFLLILIYLFLLLWRLLLISSSCCSWSFKLKFTVSYLSAFFICCSCMDLSTSKNESHFHGFIFNRLKRASNIYAKLTQFLYRFIIYKTYSFLFRTIKNYSHYCLSRSYWTVCLNMNFVNTNGLAFCDKRIKNIFTKIFSLNHNFFFICVPIWVKCC